MQPRVVRVRPDVAAVGRTFDYAVPTAWHADNRARDLRVGTKVRVELHGRRVGGWVVEVDPDPVADVALRDLAKWSGHGPSAEVIELCTWVAHRWLGSPAKAMRTASPQKNVYRLPEESVSRWLGATEAWADKCFAGAGSVVRLAPASDRWPVVLSAAAFGNPLLLVPTLDLARQLTERLRRTGLEVALLPDDWDKAAAGAVVVGTRTGALGPTRELGAVVVFDEHDDAFREERAPTWNAREVAIERARRAGVPCVLLSPAPSAVAVKTFELREPDRATEHAGWAAVEVIDRRQEPPGRLGLFSDELARHLHRDQRVACILNRTGRVRLLACVKCGELTRCDRCGGANRQIDDSTLTCTRCGKQRPPACAECGGARLKNLVLGVGRAGEELSALLGEPVGEWTAAGVRDGGARVVIGTEALLRVVPPADDRWGSVAFLDFDQHLTATRQRSDEEAMALLVLAARLVGPRRSGGRIVVQTRLPEHRVLIAARRAEPGPLTAALVEQSQVMRWPPAVAQAEVSGAGAAGFMERLGRPTGIDILGPSDERWMIRADDRELMLAELRRVDRGSERLRVAVT